MGGFRGFRYGGWGPRGGGGGGGRGGGALLAPPARFVVRSVTPRL
ncbi:hypothetical protein [Nocardia abscessus]|nr:hypothetical protein [Nocardia abscessus]